MVAFLFPGGFREVLGGIGRLLRGKELGVHKIYKSFSKSFIKIELLLPGSSREAPASKAVPNIYVNHLTHVLKVTFVLPGASGRILGAFVRGSWGERKCQNYV